MNDRDPKVIDGEVLSLAVIVILGLLVLLTAGCSLGYPPHGPRRIKPESPHPSPARIAELAGNPGAPDDRDETRFGVRFFPRALLEGGSAYAICYVPRSYGVGTFRLEVTGRGASEGSLGAAETKRLLERLACGVYSARCSVRFRRTAEGPWEEEARVADLVVRGGDCDDPGR